MAWFDVDWHHLFGLTTPIPEIIPLVRDGRMVPDNMRQHLITHGELMSQLRQQGIEDVASVCVYGR